MTSSFRFLEDVALADTAFDASGTSPSELCQAAAQAVIESMVDPGTVAPTWKRTIELTASDFPTLLFDWLSELVYLKDAEGISFRGANPTVRENLRTGWHLTANVTGAPINAEQQDLRADVKAVTKHLYEVRQEPGHWTARVVLDV